MLRRSCSVRSGLTVWCRDDLIWWWTPDRLRCERAPTDLVEAQVANAERGQDVREVRRAAAGEQVHAVEITERPDHRKNRRR